MLSHDAKSLQKQLMVSLIVYTHIEQSVEKINVSLHHEHHF